MAGYIVLEGGAEFGGLMSEPDRRAIELAGGPDEPISIIPTAAAPDNNHQRAGSNGVNWFKSLGARQVESLPLIDKTSANDPQIAGKVRQSRLIYMLGGFTGYLGETLKHSASWQAMLDDGDGGSKTGWRVYGQGAVTIYRNGQPTVYRAGESFKDDFLP